MRKDNTVYDKWITIMKGVKQAGILAIGFLIQQLINYFQTLPANQQAIEFGAIVIILRMLENYIKHKN